MTSYTTNQIIADTGAAIGASFAVAPFITIIDRAIMQNASGAKKLGPSLIDGVKDIAQLKILKRAEFYMIWALYYVTYQTAHTITTICDNTKTDVVMPKFIGTTLVNSSACIAKDRAFTRMFGTKAPTGLPWSTYGLFAARDSLTIFASFSLPPLVAKRLVKDYNFENETAQIVSQLSCPCLVQWFSTPLHLLGLNYYNAPEATTQQRLKTVGGQYVGSAVARMGRIFPAFGIGGVLSRKFRLGLQDRLGVKMNIKG